MLFALVLAAAVAAPASPAPAGDICLAMIPPRLAAQLRQENPDYDLPTLGDVPIDRLLAAAESGTWPCPFVAIADFDGDGNLDRAVILRHRSEPTVRFVVVRNDEGHWHDEVQKDWPIRIVDARVEPLEAGLYEQTKGGRDAAKQIDNLKSIQADHAGFAAGQTEGGKQAFFFVNNAWQEIWLEE